MRVGGIGGNGSAKFEARRQPGGVPDRDLPTSRALTIVTPAPRAESQRFSERRPVDAGLIAQLLATRDNLPQTRARRRASMAEALAAYAAGPFRAIEGRTRAVA
jgi:hypothetical protein